MSRIGAEFSWPDNTTGCEVPFGLFTEQAWFEREQQRIFRGPVWSFVVDASAVVLAFLSLTGLWLLFYLKKKRRSGLVTALVGTIVLVIAFAFGVA